MKKISKGFYEETGVGYNLTVDNYDNFYSDKQWQWVVKLNTGEVFCGKWYRTKKEAETEAREVMKLVLRNNK